MASYSYQRSWFGRQALHALLSVLLNPQKAKTDLYTWLQIPTGVEVSVQPSTDPAKILVHHHVWVLAVAKGRPATPSTVKPTFPSHASKLENLPSKLACKSKIGTLFGFRMGSDRVGSSATFASDGTKPQLP